MSALPGPRRAGAATAAAPLRGYAPGAFDLFHVGHLNILRRASLLCDHLTAGVVSDDVALRQKGRRPVVPERERLAVVASMRFVDATHMEWTTDKIATWRVVGFDVMFKGADWQGTPQGELLEQRFAEVGVEVVYLPYTDHTSTTALRRTATAPRPPQLAGSERLAW